MDFNSDAVTVEIPAGDGNTEMPVPIQLIDDQINEAQEGYIARLEVVSISQADEASLDNNENTRTSALIRINDDDGKLFCCCSVGVICVLLLYVVFLGV